MAVAHVGSTTHNETDPTTSCTVTIHASTAANDICVLAASNRNGNGDLTVSDDDSGTWALLYKQVIDTSRSGQFWWRRAGAGTAGATISISGATNSISAGCAVFSGASTDATPYEAAAGESNASGDEAIAEISVSANSMVIFAVWNVLNNLTASSAAGATLGALASSFHAESSGGSDCAVDLFYALSTGGGGTGAFTWSQTNNITGAAAFGLLIAAAGGGLSIPVAMYNYHRRRAA